MARPLLNQNMQIDTVSEHIQSCPDVPDFAYTGIRFLGNLHIHSMIYF